MTNEKRRYGGNLVVFVCYIILARGEGFEVWLWWGCVGGDIDDVVIVLCPVPTLSATCCQSLPHSP